MITAIQDLIECIRFTDKECYATMFNEGVFDNALKKEKEQIIESFCSGVYEGIWSDINENTKNENAEEYYNRTYNTNEI